MGGRRGEGRVDCNHESFTRNVSPSDISFQVNWSTWVTSLFVASLELAKSPHRWGGGGACSLVLWGGKLVFGWPKTETFAVTSGATRDGRERLAGPPSSVPVADPRRLPALGDRNGRCGRVHAQGRESPHAAAAGRWTLCGKRDGALATPLSLCCSGAFPSTSVKQDDFRGVRDGKQTVCQDQREEASRETTKHGPQLKRGGLAAGGRRQGQPWIESLRIAGEHTWRARGPAGGERRRLGRWDEPGGERLAVGPGVVRPDAEGGLRGGAVTKGRGGADGRVEQDQEVLSTLNPQP